MSQERLFFHLNSRRRTNLTQQTEYGELLKKTLGFHELLMFLVCID